MDILKQIIEVEGGHIPESFVDRLAAQYPAMPVVVKWGYSPRSIVPLSQLRAVIRAAMEANPSEYVREVFISAGRLDTLQDVLGLVPCVVDQPTAVDPSNGGTFTAKRPFTPGPWRLQELETNRNGYDWQTFALRSPHNVCIAIVGDVDRLEAPHNPGNARLMLAAPELLDVCSLAAGVSEHKLAELDHDQLRNLVRDIQQQAAAVIASINA